MRRIALLALWALMMAPAPAATQDAWPSKAVRILVPYAPGGATDIAARIVGERLKQATGQTFVVENRPGAFGIIAVEEMARSKPDGYTLMVGNPSTNVITPIVHKKRMSIDYGNSVVAITRLVELPSFLLVTAKDFAPKTLPELIAHAKANPDKLLYGSAGVGSFPHYSMEVLSRQAGIKMVHVPNKGGGSAYLKDLMTGDIQVGTMNVATATPVLKNGTVRAIAVTEQQRLAAHPDIPSFGELGFSRPGSGFWHGLFAPAATPRPVLEALHKAVLEALEHPQVVDAFNKRGMLRIPNPSLDDSKEWLAKETAAWTKITADVPIDFE